jgi:tetratricopeptide (TPR) repeat protein
VAAYMPLPISAACPFPSFGISKAIATLLFPELAPNKSIAESDFYGIGYKPGDGSDGDRYVTQFSDLVKTNKLSEALKMAQGFKDQSIKTRALLDIAKTYRESGDIDLAFGIIKGMTITPDTQNPGLEQRIKSDRDYELSQIAEAYIQSGKLATALQVAALTEVSSRYGVLSKIASKYREAGQSAQATELVTQALAAYRSAEKLEPSTAQLKFLTLSGFATQYAALGQNKPSVEMASEALDLAKTISQPSLFTLIFLSQNVQIYKGAQRRDPKVTATLESVLQSVQKAQEPFYKALVFAKVADMYTTLGQKQRSLQLLSQAMNLTKPQQEAAEKNIALIELARTYGVIGQYDKALQTTHAIEPSNLQTQVQQSLTCSQQKGGEGSVLDLLQGR